MNGHALLPWFSWLLARLLVLLASTAVPARLRQDWLREWKGELWQVRAASSTVHDDFACVGFAAGAIPDALCLLARFWDEPYLQPVSASRCLLLLSSMALCVSLTAFSIPGVRAEFRQMAWRTPEGLSILFLPNAKNEAAPTVTPEHFSLWKQRAHFLSSLGYYQIEDRSGGAGNRALTLRMAHGTSSLSSMVGGSESQDMQQIAAHGLILSKRIWRQLYDSDAFVPGKLIRIGTQSVPIAGIADLEDSGLPGTCDAWLFDDQPMQQGKPGFVLASFAPGTAGAPFFGFDHFAIRESSTNEVSGLSFFVSDRKPNPWSTLVLGLAFGLLALPATAPLGFGEKVQTTEKASAMQAARRWLLMLSKCLMWGLIASSTALIAGSLFTRADWRLALSTRILVSFGVALLGLRWSIHDQRRRCPVCLMQLASPAHVGEPSRSFLSWSGTELICQSGHGMMHVPAHATSWFAEQRWLALDASWQFLFAGKR